MKTKEIPLAFNLSLLAGLLAVNLYQFLIVPLLLPFTGPWLLGSLVLSVLTSNTHWFLIHEAVHGNLHSSQKANQGLARLLAVFFGAPFEALRFGHLMHHRFNGSFFDRPDLYDPARIGRPVAWLRYYAIMLGGLYLQEMATFVGFLAGGRWFRAAMASVADPGDPVESEVLALAQRRLTSPAAIARGRVELLGFAALLGASLYLYGPRWYLVPALLLGRALCISLANNLPHYDTPPGDRLYSLNLRLPRFWSRFYLDFYCHRVHHHRPTLPWIQLYRTMAESGQTYDMTFFKAVLAQFKGPRALPAEAMP
jgi:fatty acid desaturase